MDQQNIEKRRRKEGREERRKRKKEKMENPGFDPGTSRMRSERSTN